MSSPAAPSPPPPPRSPGPTGSTGSSAAGGKVAGAGGGPNGAGAAMSGAGLPKTYVPSDHEPRITAKWDGSSAFHADPSRVVRGEAEPYCIFIPPPNVTAALHLGHALNNTLQDVLIRAHRMMGYETLWLPGTDHAGIATQAVVEKRVLKEEGKRRQQFSREEFVAKIQAFKDEYEATITQQLKDMGCSCDWARQRFTMDDQCAAAVREAFFQLFKDGLIYRGKRLVNWDPALQTAVADDECYDEEIDSSFWYLRYPLVHGGEGGGAAARPSPQPVTWGELARLGYPGAESEPAEKQAWVTVATTRPETYLGDTAVAVNPRDPRAKALRGLSAQLPLAGRIIPIVEDSYVVLPAAMQEDPDEARKDPKAAYATGFLKVTPAHDPNDWEIGQRHGLQAINVMAPDATISDKHGWSDADEIKGAHIFIGKKREEARKLAVKEFEARGLLEAVKPYRHSVKHSDRSKAIVEPYLSDQWYVKVTDPRFAQSANAALAPEQRTSRQQSSPEAQGAKDGHGSLTFHPARYAKTYEQWHDNIRDWCISRQLWWGHRIPVWSKWLSPVHLTDDAQPIHEERRRVLPTELSFLTEEENRHVFVHRGDIEGDGRQSEHVAVRTMRPAIEEKLAAHGYHQDPDVLDTWFSSALWPLSTLGWPDPSAFNPDTNRDALDAFNPSSVLCTAREIITLWVSRMVMFNRYFRGMSALRADTPPPHAPTHMSARRADIPGPAPFRDVFIHAMIQDGEGRKMSKTLGNGVDPRDIIASHGADAMRFTLVQMTTNTQDVRMPVKKDSRTGKNTSEKFDGGRNYCNKLWNTARFVLEKLNKAATGRSGQGPDGRAIKAGELGLLGRWMMSRLAATVKSIDASLAAYEFSDYAESMYKLLWWDLCDWYLEGVKPTVEENRVQQAVLAHALETIVRLLHPIAPFITEAIWEHVKQVETAPIEGVTLGASRTNGLLCTAGWPRIDESWIDPEAEAEFERVRELIGAIRNVRSEHQVSPKRKVTLHASATAAVTMKSVPGLVETLAGLERVEQSVPGKATGAVAFRALGDEMHLSNLVDAGSAIDSGAERDRLGKQIESLRKTEATIAGRLSNPGYLERAPAKLVEESKAQLAATREEITALEAKIEALS